MNIFDEAHSALKSKVQVRRLFLDIHAEDLQRVISRVEAIYEEKIATQQEVEKQKARKKEALEALAKQMKKLGLSPADMKAVVDDKGTDRRKGRTRQRYLFRLGGGNNGPCSSRLHCLPGTNWQGSQVLYYQETVAIPLFA